MTFRRPSNDCDSEVQHHQQAESVVDLSGWPTRSLTSLLFPSRVPIRYFSLLLEDIYNTLSFDPELRLVRQVRSREKIPSLQEMHRSYTALVKAMTPYTRYVFLADLRQSPGNNLPDAEMLTKQLLAPPLKKLAARLSAPKRELRSLRTVKLTK